MLIAATLLELDIIKSLIVKDLTLFTNICQKPHDVESLILWNPVIRMSITPSTLHWSNHKKMLCLRVNKLDTSLMGRKKKKINFFVVC